MVITKLGHVGKTVVCFILNVVTFFVIGQLWGVAYSRSAGGDGVVDHSPIPFNGRAASRSLVRHANGTRELLNMVTHTVTDTPMTYSVVVGDSQGRDSTILDKQVGVVSHFTELVKQQGDK